MTNEQKTDLAKEIMRDLSSRRDEISITKAQLIALITNFDAGLESAESSIVAGLGAPARAWLIANQTIARRLLTRVADKRREVL